MPTYLTSLRVAANSAAAPASRAASETYDSARGQDTVTSQHNDLPLCHGMSVKPSDPSDRNSPIIEWVLLKCQVEKLPRTLKKNGMHLAYIISHASSDHMFHIIRKKIEKAYSMLHVL